MSNTLHSGLGKSQSGKPGEFLFKCLRLNSIATETVSMNTAIVSGSTHEFGYKVPAGQHATITRVIFNLVNGNIRPTNFGGVASLTTGILVEAWSSGNTVIQDFLDSTTIKQNHEFDRLASIDVVTLDAAGDDHLPIRWTIAKSGRALSLVSGQKLVVTVQDSLDGMTAFGAVVQGTVFSD